MDVTIPRLGLTMESATLVRWLIVDGDTVEKDQPVAEIETDKVTAEVLSPSSGVISGLCPPGAEALAIGTVIARISAET